MLPETVQLLVVLVVTELDDRVGRLLRIHRQADVVALGLARQFHQTRHQFAVDAPRLGELVARMQRGELDRNPRRRDDTGLAGRLADGGDRGLVGLEITIGVGHGAGRLAQHVVGVAVAARPVVAGTRQRLLDGAAHDKLAAEDAHRLGDRRADHRLAAAVHQTLQSAGQVASVALVQTHYPAGQHQRPGRGVDEQRFAVAQVGTPIGVGDLVLDQAVDGFGIGHPQQRLGQAHQHHAFLAGQAELVEEGVEPALADARAPDFLDQPPGAARDARAGVLGQRRLGRQAPHDLGLVGADIGAQRRA